jgi:hypothetical protein
VTKSDLEDKLAVMQELQNKVEHYPYNILKILPI